MGRVSAIDTDSKTVTIGFINDGQPETLVLSDKGRRAEDRFPSLIKQFSTLITANPTIMGDWCFLELPVYTRNAGSTIAQARMLGGMEAVLLQHNINFSEVNVTVWKKGLLGTGNATKEQISAFIHTVFPDLDAGLGQDELDALAIALWGSRNLSP